ncbi:hypothetical protein [Hahella ganghwensis]|uniref:hypothetical protein n=1 Tax=Hahella ganghwensis TaxID=286420 RepID=UPI00036C2D63|nr:hypothetical protein [Hahella ganghwensis]
MFFEDERKHSKERAEPDSWEDWEHDRTTGINKFKPEGVKDGLARNKRLNDRYIPNQRCK